MKIKRLKKIKTVVLVSAHRGGPSSDFPANSRKTLNRSLTLGVDFIEFDVRTTLDNKFVVYHSENIFIGGEERPIRNVMLEDLLEFDSEILTVIELLESIRGRAKAHIDIKDNFQELALADLCEEIIGPENMIVTTRHFDTVKNLRLNREHLITGLAIGENVSQMSFIKKYYTRSKELFPIKKIKNSHTNLLILNYRIANIIILTWAKRNNIPVLIFTPNDRRTIEKYMARSNVWAITTDYPEIALADG